MARNRYAEILGRRAARGIGQLRCFPASLARPLRASEQYSFLRSNRSVNGEKARYFHTWPYWGGTENPCVGSSILPLPTFLPLWIRALPRVDLGDRCRAAGTTPRSGAYGHARATSRGSHFDAFVELHLDHHGEQVADIRVVDANRAVVLNADRRDLDRRIAFNA